MDNIILHSNPHAIVFFHAQIRVTWRATGGSALENTDFFPLTGTITIRENATSGSIPLNIVDDSTPEFDETFTISIMSVAGGARIGPVSSATVTIAANDDPNGAFGKQAC